MTIFWDAELEELQEFTDVSEMTTTCINRVVMA
jgi:hypothetical protein